ncbi:VAO-type flavoprotein oxidase VAO615-like [Gigantopelta aegis]|uniref:VAO-type flavoprotein oxidase VAO615-like n=1 Tax=Gigantopelta aegis TaxID=1735272 RepID=UPI001B88C022|nr:VAO-type flavoprotein oxidase VAO615-like [Gigantopelta aegis]
MAIKISVVSAILTLLICVCTCSIIDTRCFPGQTCWPNQRQVFEFITSLSGKVYQPSNKEYSQFNTYREIRYHRSPAFVVYVTGVNDVIACMKFARKHNILVTIKSSGHSYNGRYTHDGSLQINMMKMKYKNVKIDSDRNEAGEITVETGNTWKEIYQEVQRYDRVVVGGSEHTVTPGGYTQGGGHSPISRSLGLAVDHVIEAQLVTADGRLVTARENETLVTDADDKVTRIENGDLLWAIRGGGGGVWGVIINYTFRLHRQPSGMVTSKHFFEFIVNDTVPGTQILKNLFPMLKELPPEWGGYLLINNFKTKTFQPGAWGHITLALNYFGDWDSPKRNKIKTIVDITNKHFHFMSNKTSFWDYTQGTNSTEVASSRTYIANGFLHSNETDFSDWVDAVSTFMLKNRDSAGCTGTLLGGQVNVTNPATSVSPKFRSATFAMTCYTAWLDEKDDEKHLEMGRQLNDDLVEYGDGVYYNEPSFYLPAWKEEFWGGNYDRLLAIKRKWDPDNFLWCHHCVGSDLSPSGKPGPITCAGDRANALWLVVVSLTTLTGVF